jgi:hypothetical protein
MKNQIKVLMKKYPNHKNIVVAGLTFGGTITKADRALAKLRADSVKSYIKLQLKSKAAVTSVIGISQTGNVRGIKITFNN